MNIDLRAERVNRGIGVADAAKQMGVHVSILQRAESGENKPHPRNAFKIADFYGYRVTDVWPLPEETPEPEEAAA